MAAALRTIFAQPGKEPPAQKLRDTTRAMPSRWPKAADVAAGAEEDS